MATRTCKRILATLLTALLLLLTTSVCFFSFAEEPWSTKEEMLVEMDARMLADGYIYLPTTPEGLNDGDYWYNLEADIHNISYEGIDPTEQKRWYYNPQTGTIRDVLIFENNGNYGFSYPTSGFEPDARAINCTDFLMQVGVDPLEGFTPLAHSEEEMNPGDIFYIDYEELEENEEPEVYVNADGFIKRSIGYGAYKTCVPYADGEYGNYKGWYYSYLHEIPVPTFEGFTLLPTSPIGLNVGDYWACVDLSKKYYYISEDGQTIRQAPNRRYFLDYTLENALVYWPVNQVESLEGFVQLPFTAEGLTAGSKWFDMASYLAEPGEVPEINEIYLSEDGATLRVVFQDMEVISFSSTGEEWETELFDFFNGFIKTVESVHVHSYTSFDTKAATCTETGVRTYTCDCGDSYTETIGIDSTNHVHTESHDAIASNCKETGFTAGVYCSDCNNWVSGHVITPVNPDNHAVLDENGDCLRCGTHVKDVEKPADQQPKDNLNFFQRIIQWFRNLFARLFGKG